MVKRRRRDHFFANRNEHGRAFSPSPVFLGPPPGPLAQAGMGRAFGAGRGDDMQAYWLHGRQMSSPARRWLAWCAATNFNDVRSDGSENAQQFIQRIQISASHVDDKVPFAALFPRHARLMNQSGETRGGCDPDLGDIQPLIDPGFVRLPIADPACQADFKVVPTQGMRKQLCTSTQTRLVRRELDNFVFHHATDFRIACWSADDVGSCQAKRPWSLRAVHFHENLCGSLW